jgi:archaellum component FlaC
MTTTTAVADTTSHTKLDTINSTLTDGSLTVVDLATRTKLDTVNSKLDTVNTNLGTLEDDVEATNTTLTTTNTKLDTVNTNLGTIETDIETIHTKLDTLETTLTNIETNTLKTIRQYRSEGKCRIASVDLGTTSLNEYFYLNNLLDSDKIYYVYDIQISCQFLNSGTDRVACLMSFIDGYNTGGTMSPIRNLKVSTPYSDLSNSLISSYGSSGLTLIGVKYHAEYIEMNAAGTSIYLNFQEEFIELNPGTGIQLEVIDNNDPVILSTTIRWIEEDI